MYFIPGERGLKSSSVGFSRSELSYRTALWSSTISFSFVTAPGLSMRGMMSVRSSTVDSMPTSHCSPMMTASMRPSISSRTSSAVVGLGLPERFALGAAIGLPASFMSLLAVGLDGMRIATVSRPPVVISGTMSDFLKTMVSGPGQTFVMSIDASRLSDAAPPLISGYRSVASAIWTIIGLSDGRPFAAYTEATASALRASAPSP